MIKHSVSKRHFLVLWICWMAFIVLCSCFLTTSTVKKPWYPWRRTSPVFSQRLPTAVHNTTTLTDFVILAQSIALCLRRSDLKRDDGWDGASTGWTSWMDERAAEELYQHIENLEFINKDWVNWMTLSPKPFIMDVSRQVREAVRPHVISNHDESAVASFVNRIGLSLIVLPSGQVLSQPLVSPPGAMIYGQLFLGGVTRFRWIGGSNKRRVGERRVVAPSNNTAWRQYGGPERNYQAVDMGPCVLMELVLLPKGLQIASDAARSMVVYGMDVDLRATLRFQQRQPPSASSSIYTSDQPTVLDSGSVCDLDAAFCSTIGGLRPQIDEIIRRVLDGRVVRPVGDMISQHMDRVRRQEMAGLLELGLQPVRGLLLYGSPGCGKTALAREISTILDAHPPKIVAAPELLDRWVGGSERLVRELFQDAEAELKACGGDATLSALHVIVIDEIDAVFRKRSSSGESSGEVTRASSVNQILAKLDGVQSLGNVLLIGMTNRRELLDPAMLRPGRLEVQVKIDKPNQQGRREILQIHFDALRRKGRLSPQLAKAVYGSSGDPTDPGNDDRFAPCRMFPPVTRRARWRGLAFSDLSDDKWTAGFSGADIAGLVRCAGSIALARTRVQGGRIADLLITTQDVMQALDEVNHQSNKREAHSTHMQK